MAAESPPPAAASITTETGPPTDAGLTTWLDNLPCKYQRFTAGGQGRVTDRIVLSFHGTRYAVPQNLTETMLCHGYVFRQAAPGMFVFQRVGGKTA